MAQHQYYPEEVLIEKMQSGEPFFRGVAGGICPLL